MGSPLVSTDISRYTSIDDMVSRIITSADTFDIKDIMNSSDVALWINQSIEKLQLKYDILTGEFTYDIVRGQSEYDISANNALYPYKFEHVFFGSNELSVVEHTIVYNDLATDNDIVWRCAFEWTDFQRNLLLNAIPTSDVTDGILIRGPYRPAYCAIGQTTATLLPFEKKFDDVVEALTMERAATYYLGDKALSGKSETWAQNMIAKLDAQVANG